MKTRIKMLKVKIKSLAAEAAIIRREEARALSGRMPDVILYRELREHRVRDVRREQRASLLAYAFLREKPRSACEPKHTVEPDWARVVSLVSKFGSVDPSSETKAETIRRFNEWKHAAAVAAT